MNVFEKWLALFTLLGAIATALAVFAGVVKPRPVAAAVSVYGDDTCHAVAHAGRWWLYRCAQ